MYCLLVLDTDRVQWKTVHYSEKLSAIAGSWRNPFCMLRQPEVWSRTGGRLRLEAKVAIGGDRPPRLGSVVVTLEYMREFLVAYSEYEWQMHIHNNMEETGCSRGAVSWYTRRPNIDG